MSDFPSHWGVATIGQVAQYVSRGKSPNYVEQSGLPVINQRCVRWSGIQYDNLRFIHPEQIPDWEMERYVQDGDILWNSTGTGTIGRACIVRAADLSTPKVVDSHVTIVRLRTEIMTPDFLYWWIRSPAIQGAIGAMATGTTNQIELSRRAVLLVEVPVPPIDEQERIAARLASLFDALSSCNERLGAMSDKLERVRRNLLTSMLSGGPSKENNGNSVRQVRRNFRLEDICIKDRVITYGVIKLGDPVVGGVPCLRTSNVRWLRFDLQGLKSISEQISNGHSRTVLGGGEVLVNVRGTLGGVAVAGPEMKGWNVSREIAVIPTNPEIVNSDYLAFWIGCDETQSWLARAEKGVTYTGINLEDLRNLPVELPTLEVQLEMVERIKKVFDLTLNLQTRFLSIQAKISEATSRLFERAFKGELVRRTINAESSADQALKISDLPVVGTQVRSYKKSSRRTDVKKLSVKEQLRSYVGECSEEFIIFDDVRAKLNVDYDSYRDALFELLAESDATITQQFDGELGAIRIRRVPS